MTSYAAVLLDKARMTCSPANYSALALRMGVKRQSVSSWKNGITPLPEERVRELARIAHVDEAEWWLAIQSDNAPEAMKPRLRTFLTKAGIAALLAIQTVPVLASISHISPVLPIMSRRHRLARFMRAWWSAARMRPHAQLLAL